MKLIDTKKYKGFTTEFFITPKTQSFLNKQRVDMRDHLPDTFHWYEQILFDILDPNLDEQWSEEKETRKHVKVIFYGIIEKWIDKKPKGFVEQFDEGKNMKSLGDSTTPIRAEGKKPFSVREKIMIVNEQSQKT